MKMHKTSTLIQISVVGTLLLAACSAPSVSLPGTQGAQATAAVIGERVTAQASTLENKIVGTGNVIASSTVNLAFQTTGTVSKVAIKLGDQVKAGQVLATLDDSDLQLSAQSAWTNYIAAQAAYTATVAGPTSADLRKAQSALASAQAAYNDLFAQPSETDLASLKADLDNAEAALKQAQAAYDRRAGRDPGVGASSEALTLEQATNNFNKAKAAYDAKFNKPSNSVVANASANIQSARANLAALSPVSETVTQKKAAVDAAYIAWQQADKRIKNAVIASPIDGLITAVNINVGDSVGASNAAIQIVDFAQPIFQLAVDEADLGSVQLGQEAVVQLQTYPNAPIPAKVSFISPVGTNAGSVVNYVVYLAIIKDAKTPNILLNMSGTGQVITSKIEDAVMVPTRALIANSATKTYSVQKLGADGQIETVSVLVGKRNGNNTQILSGVSAGETLVVPANSTSGGTTGTTGGNGNQGFGGGPPPPGP